MTKLEVILLIILLIFIIGGIFSIVLVIMDWQGTYECVDIQGNEVICNYVVRDKSGAWGNTEDGRIIQIISYKKIK